MTFHRIFGFDNPSIMPVMVAFFSICLNASTSYQSQVHGSTVRLLGERELTIKTNPFQQEDEKKEEEEKKEDDENDSELETVAIKNPANPKEIRLHLWDENVISGELGVDQVTMQTEFGTLKIPVEKILSVRPGLNSFPEKIAKIELLVENLGSNDYKTREAAHKELSSMGLQLRKELGNFDHGKNAERKRHLEEIRKEVELAVSEFEDDGEMEIEPALIRGDAIETRDFTVVGKILEDKFEISSRYGKLTINLADVQFADRHQQGSVQYRKSISINGKNFFQSNAKSSGIKVNRGDKITVRASGQIVMSPWGSNSSSGPDGNTSYGNYQGHGGGTLLAKIGENGKLIKIGSKETFTATKSGTIKFGIACDNNYANDDYAYPGTYQLKIVVDAAE